MANNNLLNGVRVVATGAGIFFGYKLLDYFGIFDKDTGDDNPPPIDTGKDYPINTPTFSGFMLEAIMDKQAYAKSGGIAVRILPKSNAQWFTNAAKANQSLGFIYSVANEKLPDRNKVWIHLTSSPNGKSAGYVPLEFVYIKLPLISGGTYNVDALQYAMDYAERKTKENR